MAGYSSFTTFGEAVSANARLYPDRFAAGDHSKAFTFAQLSDRSSRLANGLLGLGLKKEDRVGVLAYNRAEWIEIYAATSKSGIVMVPVNFRLVASEIAFILNDSGASALLVQDSLADRIDEIRDELTIPAQNFVVLGKARPGYRAYEEVIANASDREAGRVSPSETWALMYTSGTTGRPKGAIRTHRGSSSLSMVTAVELGFSRRDEGLLVMPMCHANSLFFATSLIYVGAGCRVFDGPHFEPERVLRMLGNGATFTSMVPTQYRMLMELPRVVRDVVSTDRVSKLMLSSAPATRETKLGIMEFFPNSGLFELYGSTEAGWVTMLHPEEQFDKLGSVGRECVGSKPARLLDEDGNEVAGDGVGELYSHTPSTFEGYWNQPEKTDQAFRDGYCSVGDLARRDADGYLYLVDRKSNMIITGGENVYPTEVEAVLTTHPSVREAAVIGMPDPKWGERVHAVVVMKPGQREPVDKILEWCRPRLAGYKRPRSGSIVTMEEIPRTATGKIQHKLLKTLLIERKTS